MQTPGAEFMQSSDFIHTMKYKWLTRRWGRPKFKTGEKSEKQANKSIQVKRQGKNAQGEVYKMNFL